MQRHRATCLSGPLSRTRRCWASPTEAASQPAAGGPPTTGREIRIELVERIRREIAEATYDSPEKLEIALERMLNRMEWE